MTNVTVTDADREAAGAVLGNNSALLRCGLASAKAEEFAADIAQAIARARAEGAASERAECDEAVQSVPTPDEWLKVIGDPLGQAFTRGLIAASDAIRARGEQGDAKGGA